MAYLTNWRMLLAGELLADPGLTTTQIPARVGPGTPFALGPAFKRRFGVSPTGYRQRTCLAPASATGTPPHDGAPPEPMEAVPTTR